MTNRILLFLMCSMIMILNGCRGSKQFVSEDFSFTALTPQGQLKTAETFSLSQVPEHINVVIINFFAPDCPPCEKEVPELKKFYNETASESEILRFVAVGSALDAVAEEIDPKTAAEHARRFKTEFELPYRVYVAGSEQLAEMGLTGFPETFIYNRSEKGDWFLQRKFISEVSFDELKEYEKPVKHLMRGEYAY